MIVIFVSETSRRIRELHLIVFGNCHVKYDSASRPAAFIEFVFSLVGMFFFKISSRSPDSFLSGLVPSLSVDNVADIANVGDSVRVVK